MRGELPPAPGLSGEFGASYTTLARQDNSDTIARNDEADITQKFALIGMRSVRPAREGLGAGTPAQEWHLQVAIGNSHDEADQTPAIPGRVVVAGTGRADNFSGLYRRAVGPRDSIEIAVAQRLMKSTDLINLGGSNYQYSEERSLLAQRVDATLGWRHRWPGVEVAASWLRVRPESQYNTANVFRQGRSWLDGAAAEVRFRRDRWTLSLAGEEASGNLTVAEQTAPAFAHVHYGASARLAAASLLAMQSWTKTDLLFSATYDRSELPFVGLAVLGEETRAFDAGERPFSKTGEWSWELLGRREISPGVHLHAYLRVTQGDETVRLTNSMGAEVSAISVRRGGRLPATQFLLGGGADFSVGNPPAAR